MDETMVSSCAFSSRLRLFVLNTMGSPGLPDGARFLSSTGDWKITFVIDRAHETPPDYQQPALGAPVAPSPPTARRPFPKIEPLSVDVLRSLRYRLSVANWPYKEALARA